MASRKRIAILISGRGSNMSALAEAAAAPDYPAEIALVLSNTARAAGLVVAQARGIETAVIDNRRFETREAFDDAMTASLENAGVELICNAGFMRLHSAKFVLHWRGRQLNIHPSLLPSFRGLHPHRQALAAGVRISGCTVHFVTEETDAGPIVAQGAVPVYPQDTEDELAARILRMEHRLYPTALRLVASGQAAMNDDGKLTAPSENLCYFAE